MYSYSLELILRWVGTSTCNCDTLSDEAKAVYLATAETGTLEDGRGFCKDNSARLNVYQVGAIELDFFSALLRYVSD